MSEPTTLRDSKGRPWLVMIGCCLMMATCFSVPSTCSTLFIAPVCEQFGFTRAAFTISTSIMSLIQIVSMPMAGKILGSKKVDSRITLSICVILMGGGFMLLSKATKLWQWYVLYGIMGFVTPWCTVVAISIFINNWFKDKVGLAMGIASAASGIGSAVLSPIFTNLIVTNGWQSTYVYMGLYLIVFGLPLSATIMVFHPNRIGMRPYENKATKEAAEAAPAAESAAPAAAEIPGLTVEEGRKNPAFYMLFLVTVLFGFSAAVNTHAASMMYGAFDMTKAGAFVSFLMVGVASGKIILGAINDKFGGKATAGFGCISMAVGIAMVIVSTLKGIYPLACAAGIFTGFGVATTTFTPALLTASAMGRKGFSSLYSTIMVGFTVGSAIGTPLLGAIYDINQSYTAALIAIIAAILVAFVVALMAIKIGQKAWMNK